MPNKPIILLAFQNDRRAGRGLPRLTEEMAELSAILNKGFMVSMKPVGRRDLIFDAFDVHGKQIRVFHFGGHADGSGLETEDQDPLHRKSYAEGLAGFMGAQKGVRLVFLNACSTAGQVEHFHKAGIPAVIATLYPVLDSVAQEFATHFYQSLIHGRSISEAFEQGKHKLRTKYDGFQDLYHRGFEREEEGSQQAKFPYELFLKSPDAGVEKLSDWKETTEPVPRKDALFDHQHPRNPLLYLLLDRMDQNDNFEDELRMYLRKVGKKPQFYVIHGAHPELPNSLAERFYEFSARDVLKTEFPERAPKLNPARFRRYLIDWPDAKYFDPKSRYKPFHRLLDNFRKADVKTLASAADLLGEIAFQKEMVLIQHNIMAKNWHPGIDRFLQEEYLPFWEVVRKEDEGHVVILFNITYEQKGGWKWLKRSPDKLIQQCMQSLSEKNEQFFFIDQLAKVPRSDLIAWQYKHLPHRNSLADEIFGKKDQLCMNEIEDRLRQELKRHNV